MLNATLLEMTQPLFSVSEAEAAEREELVALAKQLREITSLRIAGSVLCCGL
jgi:hypothetical protein